MERNLLTGSLKYSIIMTQTFDFGILGIQKSVLYKDIWFIIAENALFSTGLDNAIK